jgi:hypothetical protein
MAHRPVAQALLRSIFMWQSRLVVVASVWPLLVGCGGAGDDEATTTQRYTVDVSHYTAPNEPPGLFISNANLVLPLEAKDLTLTSAEPGSLESIYSRSYCETGQTPPELPGWDTAQLLDVAPVHLTAVSITVAFDGNDLLRKPSFSVQDSAKNWSGCTPATQVASNDRTLTATLAIDAADATLVAIFPETHTYVQRISYSTRD